MRISDQERLKLEIEVTEEWVEQREEMNEGLNAFITLTQKYVDVEELPPTIINEYIKKIVVYARTSPAADEHSKRKWHIWNISNFHKIISVSRGKRLAIFGKEC